LLIAITAPEDKSERESNVNTISLNLSRRGKRRGTNSGREGSICLKGNDPDRRWFGGRGSVVLTSGGETHGIFTGYGT